MELGPQTPLVVQENLSRAIMYSKVWQTSLWYSWCFLHRIYLFEYANGAGALFIAQAKLLYTFDSGCGKSAIKNNCGKVEHLKHEKRFIYKVLKPLNNYCSFSCSVCFRSSRTSIILRVIAWGSTNTLSFKNPSIACGSRIDAMKESSSRPYLKACHIWQSCFSWLQYIFFSLYTILLNQPI